MWKRLENLITITEDKFGFKDYRSPIVWIDKVILVGGILAAIIGRIVAVMWAVAFVLEKSGPLCSWSFLICGILLWAAGEYFTRTGNRGLIYHHMDLLAEYLDKRRAPSDTGG